MDDLFDRCHCINKRQYCNNDSITNLFDRSKEGNMIEKKKTSCRTECDKPVIDARFDFDCDDWRGLVTLLVVIAVDDVDEDTGAYHQSGIGDHRDDGDIDIIDQCPLEEVRHRDHRFCYRIDDDKKHQYGSEDKEEILNGPMGILRSPLCGHCLSQRARSLSKGQE